MELEQIDVTGCRLIGAITEELSHLGPKHHAIVIGRNIKDGLIYVAEHMHTGYQLETVNDFKARYGSNGRIEVKKNAGPFDNLTVARRALEEIKQGGRGVYNLVTNNCECFANRAMHGTSSSQQIINTAVGVLGVTAVVGGAIYYFSKNNK